MASHSSFQNTPASCRPKGQAQNAKKVPFRSANPINLQDISHVVSAKECPDVGPFAAPSQKLMAEGTSPLRGRTMKEYDQQIGDLKNENFNLKLRIFLMEQSMQHKLGESAVDIHRLNFELKVQLENLKRELGNKKELLVKASNALESLEQAHKTEISNLQQQFEDQRKALELQLQQLKLNMDNVDSDPGTCNALSDERSQEEFYQQAFLPLHAETSQGNKETDQDMKLKALQKLSEEQQFSIQALQNKLLEKENFIKDEEVNNLKRNKVIQGLVATVRTKEKEIIQLQEELKQKDGDLKMVKDELNLMKKLEVESDSGGVKNKETEDVTTSISAAFESPEDSIQNALASLKVENTSLKQELKDMLIQKDNAIETIKHELEKQLKDKEESLDQLQRLRENRDHIIRECMSMVGIEESFELSDLKTNAITDAIRLKLKENEEINQFALEEKIKLMKENENEVIQQQQKIEELEKVQDVLKSDLKQAQDMIVHIQEELVQRNCRVQDLLDLLKNLHEENNEAKEKLSNVIIEKDAIIRKLQKSFVASEKELQGSNSNDKENEATSALCLSSVSNSLEQCISEKDKLIEDLIMDKNKVLIESERSVQSLTVTLREKDVILKDVHDRLIQEQNNRISERDQLQAELGKKNVEIKNLENCILKNEDQHQSTLKKLQIALEEKDKLIQSLMESNTRKEKDFRHFFASTPGNSSTMMLETDPQYLKDTIDELNKRLLVKEDYFLSVRKTIQQLVKFTLTTCSTELSSLDESNKVSFDSSLEDDLKLVEQKFVESLQRNEQLLEQLKGMNSKVIELRHLLEHCYGKENFGGAGDMMFDKDDFERNITCLLVEVKSIANLKEMLQTIFEYTKEICISDKDSINHQTLMDVVLEIQHIKTKLNSNDLLMEQTATGKYYGDEVSEIATSLTDSPSQYLKRNKTRFPVTISSSQMQLNAHSKNFETSNSFIGCLLQDAQSEIQHLKDKLSSTENTVRLLGTKVKHYRQLLSETGNVPVTPNTPSDRQDISCFPTPPSGQTDLEDFMDKRVLSTPLATRRSVSAEDICLSGKSAVVTDENQALSAEDVLTTVTASALERKHSLDRSSSSVKVSVMNTEHSAHVTWTSASSRSQLQCSSINDSHSVEPRNKSTTTQFLRFNDRFSTRSHTPYTPDSMNDFGQTNDVLELKEQIFCLKLQLDQYFHDMTGNKKKEFVVEDTKDKTGINAASQTDTKILEDEGSPSLLVSPLEFQWLQQQNNILQMKLDTLLSEIPEGQQSSFIQLQQQEINSLRNHLYESHNACELLRIRLEELADFLEQLLRFDEHGLLDISRFTPQRIASLQRHIAQSRDLSINLSQSLLIDGDMSVLSNCIESTLLHDQDNSVLTDYDSSANCDRSALSQKYFSLMSKTKDAHKQSDTMKSASFQEINKEDVYKNQIFREKMVTTTSHASVLCETPPLQSLGTLTNQREYSVKNMAQNNSKFPIELQWQRLENSNKNEKPAQSSYDDMILLLDTKNDGEKKQEHQEQSAVSKTLQSGAPQDQNNLRTIEADQEQAIMANYVQECPEKELNLLLNHKNQLALTSVGEGLSQEASLVQRLKLTISPTDSESWSEPDRDVSQQRMGLEPEFCSPGEKSQLGRSPKSSRHRNTKTGSSNTDSSEKFSLGRKTRSDAWELWRLRVRLQNLEEVNASLRSELQIYQSLPRNGPLIFDLKRPENISCTTEDGKRPFSAPSSQRPLEKDAHSDSNKTEAILQEHLTEIRMLRLRMEESICINDQLQERLEKKLLVQESAPESQRREIERDETRLLGKKNMKAFDEKNLLEEFEYQSQLYSKEKSEMEKEIQSLKHQAHDLSEKLQLKEGEIHQLQSNLSDRDNAGDQLKQANQRLQNSLNHINTALNDKDRVCKELREANGRMQRTLDAVDKLISQKDAQLTNAQNQHGQLVKELDDARQKHHEMSSHFSKLIDETNKNAEKKLKVWQRKNIAELDKLHLQYRNEMEALSKFVGDKEKKLNELNELVNTLQTELTAKEDNLQMLQKNFEEMSVAVLETEKHLEAEHGQNLSLQQRVSSLNKSVTEKEKEVFSLQERIHELEHIQSEMDSQNLSSQMKQADLQKELINCQREVVAKDQQILTLRKAVDKMQEVILEKKKVLERQLEKAQNLEDKLELLSSSATEKEKRCQEECALKQCLQDQIKKQEKEMAVAKELLKTAHENSEQLRDQLATQEKKYLDLQNKLDERGNVIRKLEEELHQSWEDNEKLQQRMISVQTMLHETNNLNKSMKTELQVYEHLHSNFISNTSDSKDKPTNDLSLEVLLNEIRNLRMQLELSIQTSSALRSQLEQQFSPTSTDFQEKEASDKTIFNGNEELGKSSRLLDPYENDVPVSDKHKELEKQNEFNKLTWTIGLEPNQDSIQASSNSIESGQFSDIDSTTVPKVDDKHSNGRSSDSISEGLHNDVQNMPLKLETKTKEVDRKLASSKKRPTNLQIPERFCGHSNRTNGIELTDLHSVYSSPDLGIESDPNQFSCLEQKMSHITDEHLWAIRTKQIADKKVSTKDATFPFGSLELQADSDRRLLYAIGRLDDYELLKKEVEQIADLLKELQTRIKDRIWSSSTNTPVKDKEYITWKEVQSGAENIKFYLGKSLQIIGYFWTAMLPSENGLNKDEIEKMIQENSLLRRKIRHQKKMLNDTNQKLSASNRLKEGMEKAIMKQLSKTHDVLKKAKGNLEDQQMSQLETRQAASSSAPEMLHKALG